MPILDGLFVLYPMKAPTREREKNPVIIEKLKREYKYFIDLPRKKPEQALEGTGSLLFDNENKKVFVNISVRADSDLLSDFMEHFNNLSKTSYTPCEWESVDRDGNPVYHTNVVMAILRDHVVLCTESIRDKRQRDKVISAITQQAQNNRPRKIIDINYDEMYEMCGNMIMVQNKQGEHCVIMSERARLGLRKENLNVLEQNYRIVSSDLKMIETIGGGSARCMVAELF